MTETVGDGSYCRQGPAPLLLLLLYTTPSSYTPPSPPDRIKYKIKMRLYFIDPSRENKDVTAIKIKGVREGI